MYLSIHVYLSIYIYIYIYIYKYTYIYYIHISYLLCFIYSSNSKDPYGTRGPWAILNVCLSVYSCMQQVRTLRRCWLRKIGRSIAHLSSPLILPPFAEIYQPVCLSVLSFCLSVCLFVRLSVLSVCFVCLFCLSVLSVCFVCLSVCLSVGQSDCLSVYLSVCRSVCLSVRLSVCPSVSGNFWRG